MVFVIISMIQKTKSVINRIVEEIKKCDKDYNRYQVPCDWQNIGISDSVSVILTNLLMDCEHNDLNRWCDDCQKKFKELYTK